MIKKLIPILLITVAINTNFVFSNNKIDTTSYNVVELKLDTVNNEFDEKRITIDKYEENTFYKLPLDNSLKASGFIIKNGTIEFKFSDYKQFESVNDTNPISLTAYKAYTASPYFSKILNKDNYKNTKIKLNDEMTFIVVDSSKNNKICEDENCLTLFFK